MGMTTTQHKRLAMLACSCMAILITPSVMAILMTLYFSVSLQLSVDQLVFNVVTKWLFRLQTVQQRGAAVIAARKLSSAMSAAKATCDHLRDWWNGTKPVSDCLLSVHFLLHCLMWYCNTIARDKHSVITNNALFCLLSSRTIPPTCFSLEIRVIDRIETLTLCALWSDKWSFTLFGNVTYFTEGFRSSNISLSGCQYTKH